MQDENIKENLNKLMTLIPQQLRGKSVQETTGNFESDPNLPSSSFSRSRSE